LKEVAISVELIRLLANRIFNLLHAELNYLLSYVGICRYTHMPTFVSIEPANYCPLHCPECPVGQSGDNNNRQVLSLALYKQILEQVSPWVHTIQFYFQGEPLLNPDLPEMIRLAHQQKIYTIVSTNGQKLSKQLAQKLVEAGLSRIIVSIDGLSEESYSSYRKGGNLHKALAGLGYLREAKRERGGKTKIEIQCLCLRSNEHEWEMLRRSYKKMGADCLTLKTAQFYDYENGNPLMPQNNKYCRYAQGKDGKYYPKNRMGRTIQRCRRLYMGCVIDVNGNVLPCCFDKQRQYVFGNIQQQPIETCWKGDEAQERRKKLLHNMPTLSMCQNCTE